MLDTLSEREMQVMIMVANCDSVNTIAERLHLSPKTVNTYRYRIFEKISITSDVELTVLAIRPGMIDFTNGAAPKGEIGRAPDSDRCWVYGLISLVPDTIKKKKI